MADTYLTNSRDSSNDYGRDPGDPDKQNQLYKALLQQTMQQPQSPGMGGIITKMLGTYMNMGGNPMGMFGGGLNDQVNALDTASGLL